MTVVVAFVVLAWVVLAIRRGKYGRILLATRDSQAACATLGFSTTLTRIAVFSASAGLAGVAGVLFAGMQTHVGTLDFYFFKSLPLLLFAIVFGSRRSPACWPAAWSTVLPPVPITPRQPDEHRLHRAVHRDPAAGQQPERPGRPAFERGRRLRLLRAAGPRGPGGLPASAVSGAWRLPLALLEIEDVLVRFGGVVAVNGATFEVPESSRHRPDGPQRRRQDDAVQRHHRAAGADQRAGALRRPATSPRCTPGSAPLAGIGRTFQRLEVFGSLSVATTSRWPPRCAASSTPGGPRRAARPGRPARLRQRHRRLRADRHRPAHRARPGAGRATRGCCCSTSRRAGSARPRPRTSRVLVRSLAEDDGPLGPHRRARRRARPRPVLHDPRARLRHHHRQRDAGADPVRPAGPGRLPRRRRGRRTPSRRSALTTATVTPESRRRQRPRRHRPHRRLRPHRGAARCHASRSRAAASSLCSAPTVPARPPR